MKIFGIDASKYHETIDWAKAKAGGVLLNPYVIGR